MNDLRMALWNREAAIYLKLNQLYAQIPDFMTRGVTEEKAKELYEQAIRELDEEERCKSSG